MQDNEREKREAMNRYKRPHYAIGDRVRVVAEGPNNGVEGIVTKIVAWQNISGYVAMYSYHIRLDNLAIQAWNETQIAPLA